MGGKRQTKKSNVNGKGKKGKKKQISNHKKIQLNNIQEEREKNVKTKYTVIRKVYLI